MTAKKLTPKQQRFVEEYLIDFNATQAAIRAGYSAKTAHASGPRLLENVGVAAALAHHTAARAKRVEVTADYVLTRLVENVQRAMQLEPVFDADGNETGVYVYAGAVANKALELLGKHLGMFADVHKHVGANGGAIQHATELVITFVRPTSADTHAIALPAPNGNGRHVGNGKAAH